MTEQERWLDQARAANGRARMHVALARLAQHDHNLALAWARDATLTPLEAAAAAAGSTPTTRT